MTFPRNRKARAARKRSKRMASRTHDLTDDQWAALQEAWGECAYCGEKDTALQRDCILPIARGGRYTLDNIAPACASCNASKSHSEVTSWLRRTKRSERAFLERHIDVQRQLSTLFPASHSTTAEEPQVPA